MNNEKTLSSCVEKLAKRNMAQYLDFADSQKFGLSPSEIRFLLVEASILSLSEVSDDVSTSYEICSRLVEIYGSTNPVIITTSDLILSRIGNFPGRTLLRTKYELKEKSTPFPLAVEKLARETENSIDDTTLLTDFQYRLYSALSAEKSLSVSAPTSAGKSHVLNLDLVRRLRYGANPCIVYIVPTRALVSEVVARIRSTVRREELDGVAIRTAPFPAIEDKERRGLIYVLTQERFLRLLSFPPKQVNISTLIIDEAHEVQKGKRGVLLQNAIDVGLKKYPHVSVLFASPLIKNPAYLLSVFRRLENGRYFTERVSPVSQNVILISEALQKPKKVKVELLNGEKLIEIGQADLSFSFRGSKAQQKALFTLEICNENESAILFSDDAADAEECATTIAAKIQDVDIPEDIKDFISFIRTDIHPEYPLIETLKKGVAFHYGNMPSIVRNGVERIFKEGRIRYLCSTSTLLQGVNLPAKHIVIQNPHLGTEAMTRADFRNLAGRAGRLLKEFHGNVWCLRPGSWEIECYKGDELQEIKSAMDQVMDDGGTLVSAILDGIDVKEKIDLAEAAFSRLYYEVSESGAAETFNNYKTEINEEALTNNINQMKSLNIDVPAAVLEAHRSLRPDYLQNLLEILRNYPVLENINLVSPYESGSKNRMKAAIALINQAFHVEMPDKYFGWVCTTAYQWIWGTPIGELLENRVSFIRVKKPDAKASPLIRDLLKLIETEIRYKLVKHFAAYEDLFKIVWVEKKGDIPVTVAPYHTYLEFGSADKAALSLMALGLSRFTALKIKKVIHFVDEKEPEDYLRRIADTQIRTLPIPKLCKQELYDLLGLT